MNGQFESKVFGAYNKLRRKILRPDDLPRSWVDPGHKTGTAGNKRSAATKAMTDTTKS